MSTNRDHSGPDSTTDPGRRRFIRTAAASGLGLVVGETGRARAEDEAPRRPDYAGPNVVIVRFGGGVRRRETIDPSHTHSPWLCHELTKRGVLFRDMMIDSFQNVNTSHGEGTLYILTGKYERFRSVDRRFLSERFESAVPTVFEYLRSAYSIPHHQTLIINGEDRTQEEFYSFSNHHLFGVDYRSAVLSLYRYKVYLLERQLAEGRWDGPKRAAKEGELRKMRAVDHRTGSRETEVGPEIDGFWERWRAFYGESGLVNPRGDRLLTELTLRAMKDLRPRLVMVNYNDPDYVHWGNMSHYTRGIAVIDEGLRRLVEAVEADEFYRGNTIFVIVPDCGRDSNPLVPVPCQHHFNSRSSHEIWALLMGPGIPRGRVIDRRVDQISLAATVGALMRMETPFAEGPALEDAIA